MSDNFNLSAAARALDGALSRMVYGVTAPPLAGDAWQAAIAPYRAARALTIELIRGLSQTQSDFCTGPTVWSVGQVVEHLLLIEKLYRGHMVSLIQLAKNGGATDIAIGFDEIDNAVAYIPREMMPLFTVPLRMYNAFMPRAVRETMFRIPLIPAENPSVANPARGRPITGLRERAVSSLAETEEVFRGDLPPDLGKMTLSHPVLGTNTIVQLFGIITAHEERHQGQIRTVLRNARFPKIT